MIGTIRPLRSKDTAAYRDIRLEALRAHPESFGASFADEAVRPPAFFAARLTGGTIFGAFVDGTLVGTAGLMIQPGAKRRHKGMLWGMYLRPDRRGSGLARRLVEAVLDHARDRVELVQLSVVSDNAVARRLYSSLGFEPYGIEARALRIGDRHWDEVLMVKIPP